VVKLICYKASSPPHNIIRQVAPMCTRSNTCFLGPTRVHITNVISIRLSVYAGLTIVTDRPTDRPLYSVCKGASTYYYCDAA